MSKFYLIFLFTVLISLFENKLFFQKLHDPKNIILPKYMLWNILFPLHLNSTLAKPSRKPETKESKTLVLSSLTSHSLTARHQKPNHCEAGRNYCGKINNFPQHESDY